MGIWIVPCSYICLRQKTGADLSKSPTVASLCKLIALRPSKKKIGSQATFFQIRWGRQVFLFFIFNLTSCLECLYPRHMAQVNDVLQEEVMSTSKALRLFCIEGDWSFTFKVLLLLLSLCLTKLNLRYQPNNATASETLTDNMTLSKESVFDLPIDALTEKSLYLASNSQPVPTLPLHIEVYKDRQQRPLYCNPPLYSMGGWLLPQQISDTKKERTLSVFPSFLSPTVTTFLCQCYMNAYLSLRCISIYANTLKMYIIKLRIETDKKIRIYVKLLQFFFFHFVVEKNWMPGVKNTCGGAWEPILFFLALLYWYIAQRTWFY